MNKKDIKIGLKIVNENNEIGTIISIRENEVVYNVNSTGKIKKSLFENIKMESIGSMNTNAPPYFFGGVGDYPNKDNLDDNDPPPSKRKMKEAIGSDNPNSLYIMPQEIKDKKMNETSSVPKIVKEYSEKYKIPENHLKKIYNRGIFEWSKGTSYRLPQHLAEEVVKTYISELIHPRNKKILQKLQQDSLNLTAPPSGKNEYDKMFESHLIGTDESSIAFKAMTPGQEGYGNKISHHTDYDTIDAKRKKKLLMGSDLNSRAGDNASAGVGGFTGGGPSINNFDLKENELPNNEKIRKWALREDIQKIFIHRYGNNAKHELIKAAGRMVTEMSTMNTFKIVAKKLRKETKELETPEAFGSAGYAHQGK